MSNSTRALLALGSMILIVGIVVAAGLLFFREEAFACVHRWSDWSVTKAVTCEEAGFSERICSLCQEKETSEIPAVGHEDANLDHVCENDCQKKLGICKDANLDHKCDYGCSKTYGICEDANLDHACDYGCSKAYGTCEDADKNHACDYGCSKTYGACKDANLDHTCDYGCSKAYGTCADVNLDHACDYGCSKAYGTCEDADKNHTCDYGCTLMYGVCEDVDFDHICDYHGCLKGHGVCEDANLDHTCDYGCALTYGVCEDTDFDHECDYGCSVTYGVCTDINFDHICDYGCDLELGLCEDANFDHGCDYGCSYEFGVCEDANLDHACDYGCQRYFGEHFDESRDGDHLCDYGCGRKATVCSDKNPKDGKCDECGEDIAHTCYDRNKDHKCDVCKKIISEHTDSATVDQRCDICGTSLVDTYFANLFLSFKDINEFSVKLKDFSYRAEKSRTFFDRLTPVGRIEQIDVAELCLYIEDGALGGTAFGAILLYEDPFSTIGEAYRFEALISNRYIYIELKCGEEGAEQEVHSLKVSVDTLLEAALRALHIEKEQFDTVIGGLLPLLGEIVSSDKKAFEDLFESAFNLFFAFEKQADESFIAVLDFGKLYALNEHLANKPFKEVLELYFGEGVFDFIAGELQSRSLYAILGNGEGDIQESVAVILGMLSESVNVSFATSYTGALTSACIVFDGVAYEDAESEIYVRFTAEVLIDETTQAAR